MSIAEEKLARGISAASRRDILRLLVDREMTVKEISKKTGQSVSLASRHLTLLHDLGLLDVRKKFPNKFYSLRIKEIVPLLEIYHKVIQKL